MKQQNIKLGYEIGTGNIVEVTPSHLIVTGITQLSGKTTTMEALIKRSGFKAIVFKTKVGERSFTEGTEVPPFFRDRSDYEFVKSLIEAYSKEKLFIEKGTLMMLCKGSISLQDIKKRVDDALLNTKLRGIQVEIYTRLQHYLDNLIPQIAYQHLSKTLNTYEGINIMNLERFTEEAQSLIIQSVADEVLKNMKDTILVIPEAWKFVPQKYNNPCKRVVESYIRQGAANRNFIWIDSQDMAGVDKIPLKQISTWILGYQTERNEVKHTLDQIGLPKKSKPKEEEIMMLRKGHFFISSYDGVKKVYVQPTWLSDEQAMSIAKGEQSVEEVQRPDNLVPFTQALPTTNIIPTTVVDDSKTKRELIELRNDFFNKIQELQGNLQQVHTEVYTLRQQQQPVNINEIVSKVLQKIPLQNTAVPSINKEAFITEILQRIPQNGGVTYTVAPVEMIKRKFVSDAKEKIITDIRTLSKNAKKTLKYLESQGVGCTIADICTKGFMFKNSAGGYNTTANEAMKELSNIQVGEKQINGKCFGRTERRIKDLLEVQGAKPEEIQQVYDHILTELLGNE